MGCSHVRASALSRRRIAAARHPDRARASRSRRWRGHHPTAGDAIPLEARIIAVADVYDSLTSDRPYRKAMSPFDAKAIIEKGAGTEFDPMVVEAFLAAFRHGDLEVRPPVDRSGLSRCRSTGTIDGMSARMPVVFVPHGGGPWPFVEMGFPPDDVARLAGYLRSVRHVPPEPPRALLVVSAHWEAPVPTVMTSEHPPMLYDYFGFPPESYTITWPAPGSPALASRVRALLGDRGHRFCCCERYKWNKQRRDSPLRVFVSVEKMMVPKSGSKGPQIQAL